MKRIFLITAICILQSAFCITFAQSGLGEMQRGVGQTSGDKITEKNVAIGKEGTYKLAAMLTADDLKPYVGCEIVGIRFALGMDMQRSSIFLNTISNNEINDPVISQTTRYPSAGWNNIFFNSGKKYTITGEEDLLFGYEYTETAAMVANDEGAICINGDNTSGNGFYLYGNFGQGDGWYSSETGNLCVQLIVDISNMPAHDIQYTTFTAGHKYKTADEGVDFLCGFSNAGRDNIETVDFSFLIDNEQIGDYHCVNTKSENAITIDYRVDFPEPLSVGEHNFTIVLEKINGKDVDIVRTVGEDFVVYDGTLGRQKHYVEQYMSQKSTYSQYTDKIMSEVADNSKVCLVNMYNADGTLAVPEAAKYISRYAYDFPCFTVDRSYFPGEQYVAYDVNYYAQVVPDIMIGVIGEIVAEQDLYPAFATVEIAPEYDATSRALNIEVSGDLIEGAKALMGNNAVLTVMLTENKVAASQIVTDKTGRNKTNTSYVHNHVLRKFVSDADGDAIDLSGNSYKKNYSITLPKNIKAENVEIVAIVSRGVDEDAFSINNYDVTNCNSVKLESYITGIKNVNSDFDLETSKSQDIIYNLNGQRILAPRHGASEGFKGIVIRGGKKFVTK
ncbi:MAG: Omp28-related outer membrane protein [Bacteroidaceae bacterium]|nr:Omp28-related outer membrane protein [Bacteroidaceae bacterium]